MHKEKRFAAFRAKLEDSSRLGIGIAATRYSFKMRCILLRFAQALIAQVELRVHTREKALFEKEGGVARKRDDG